MSNDWYAKRLGVTTPLARGISVGPGPVATAPPLQQQPAPVQQYVPPQQPVSDRPETFSEVLRAGRGGPAAKAGIGNCPNCGSGNMFAPQGGSIMKEDGRMVSPVSKCFDCGYNGNYMQADKANWASA